MNVPQSWKEAKVENSIRGGAMEPLGSAAQIADLVPIFRAYRMRLGLNQREVDQAAGMADGLTGKIEIGTRGLGLESCNALLRAYGLRLVVQQAGALLGDVPTSSKAAKEVSKLKLINRQRLGGRNRWAGVSEKKKREHLRRAAKISAEKRSKQAKMRAAARNRAKSLAEKTAAAGFGVVPQNLRR